MRDFASGLLSFSIGAGIAVLSAVAMIFVYQGASVSSIDAASDNSVVVTDRPAALPDAR